MKHPNTLDIIHILIYIGRRCLKTIIIVRDVTESNQLF